MSVMVATGVNNDGHREVLGVQVATGETHAGWLGFFRDLTARGLTGVAMVTSDAHAGPVEALPGASWQRCRTHYAANLIAAGPKAAWPGVKAMLHSVYDQPDAVAVHAQFDKLLDSELLTSLPAVLEHLDAARADILTFTAFPKEVLYAPVPQIGPLASANSSPTDEPKRAAKTPSGTHAQRNAAPAGDVAPAVRVHIRAGQRPTALDAQLAPYWLRARPVAP